METFVPIIYNNSYKISNLGRVFSLKTNKILSNRLTGSGYFKVNFKVNGKDKPYQIHRLVAIHFIPNPGNKKEVHHKNHIKTDNRVENLAWVTPSENLKEARDGGFMGVAKIDNQIANCIRNDYKNEKTTLRKLAQKYNLGKSQVGNIINNVCWS